MAPIVVAPTVGNRVKPPSLAMLTGIAATEPDVGNSCGADDHDCVAPTFGELQALLGGALTFTTLAPGFALELEKLA
jgi:hypothetical protein